LNGAPARIVALFAILAGCADRNGPTALEARAGPDLLATLQRPSDAFCASGAKPGALLHLGDVSLGADGPGEWALLAKPAGPDAKLTVSGTTATFETCAAGEYLVGLTVKRGSLESRAYVGIRILEAPNGGGPDGGPDAGPGPDGGPGDGGPGDGGGDGGPGPDAGSSDGGAPDAATPDAGSAVPLVQIVLPGGARVAQNTVLPGDSVVLSASNAGAGGLSGCTGWTVTAKPAGAPAATWYPSGCDLTLYPNAPGDWVIDATVKDAAGAPHPSAGTGGSATVHVAGYRTVATAPGGTSFTSANLDPVGTQLVTTSDQGESFATSLSGGVTSANSCSVRGQGSRGLALNVGTGQLAYGWVNDNKLALITLGGASCSTSLDAHEPTWIVEPTDGGFYVATFKGVFRYLKVGGESAWTQNNLQVFAIEPDPRASQRGFWFSQGTKAYWANDPDPGAMAPTSIDASLSARVEAIRYVEASFLASPALFLGTAGGIERYDDASNPASPKNRVNMSMPATTPQVLSIQQEPELLANGQPNPQAHDLWILVSDGLFGTFASSAVVRLDHKRPGANGGWIVVPVTGGFPAASPPRWAMPYSVGAQRGLAVTFIGEAGVLQAP
jgi:hypothetical protein